jgi:hypothetical protein
VSDERSLRLSAALGALFAGAAYLVTTAGRVGLFFYLPVERRWTLLEPPRSIAMDWFARALWTLLALVVGALVGAWIESRSSRDLRRVTAALWQLAALLLAWGAVFTVLWLLRG